MLSEQIEDVLHRQVLKWDGRIQRENSPWIENQAKTVRAELPVETDDMVHRNVFNLLH